MTITNIIALIVAIITCFWGYKLNKFLISIFGLILGFAIGIEYLPNFINDQTTVYIISEIIGLAIGFISYNLYLAGIFFLCAIAVFVLCGNLGLTEELQTIIGLVAGIIAGIIGVKFTRPIMIIATSLSGASIITDIAFNLLSYQNELLIFIISLVLATFGMIYQFKQKEIN